MSKFRQICATVVVVCVSAVAGSASAAIIFSEDFAYADGNLGGQSGGTGFPGAWTDTSGDPSNNISVDGQAAYSNPNSTLQNSQVNRAFSAFTESAFVLRLDYQVVANVEGSYDFQVVLRDGNDLEIFSLGNRNNQGASGEYYVARLGSGGGVQAQQTLGASETFSDTVTISATLSGSTITADITSTAFPSMNATGLSRNLSSTIDFSGGGLLRIQKSGLDGMQIKTDNIQLSVIPEPSTLALLALSASALIFLGRRGYFACGTR